MRATPPHPQRVFMQQRPSVPPPRPGGLGRSRRASAVCAPDRRPVIKGRRACARPTPGLSVRATAARPEQGVQEPFGLAQREMGEEPQDHGGFDGEIRVSPLPAPPAAPAGHPGSNCFQGQPHRQIAASNEGLIVGRPVRNAILRLIRGMNLRLHPHRMAPAERSEKCAASCPTRRRSSCNNAMNTKIPRSLSGAGL